MTRKGGFIKTSPFLINIQNKENYFYKKEGLKRIRMKEKEQKILEFMQDEDYVPMKAKEIAMIMRVPKNEYKDFLELLR